MNKWDLIKIKTTCTAKETINKMKRQPTEWKKIFLNNMIGKGLICKIYNSSYNSTSETHTHTHTHTHTQSDFKRGRRPEQTFFKRRHTDGQ